MLLPHIMANRYAELEKFTDRKIQSQLIRVNYHKIQMHTIRHAIPRSKTNDPSKRHPVQESAVNIDCSITDQISDDDPPEENCKTTSSKKQIILISSIFSERPPTIFCNYPVASNLERNKERSFVPKLKIKAYFKIENAVRYACVLNAFKSAGFIETEGNNWNVLWSAPIKSDALKIFTKYQKCNHFPAAWQLGRKDNLWVNMYKMRRIFNEEYDLCPQTYLFPDDYARFQVEREANLDSMYIMKPVASACGKGIKVYGKKQAIPKKSGHLVSRYIENPHVFNGFKYDLRIYILVTSFDPLRIYIYKNGIVRFATQKYNTSPKCTKKKFVHLTNFAVNKKNSKFKYNEEAEVYFIIRKMERVVNGL